jgi:hypothetical protein
MREDPSDRNRRKTKGNVFLANWVSREQEKLAALPQPAKPVELVRKIPLGQPPCPIPGLEVRPKPKAEPKPVDPLSLPISAEEWAEHEAQKAELEQRRRERVSA